MTKDQKKRPSVSQLLEHPWISAHMRVANPRGMVQRGGGCAWGRMEGAVSGLTAVPVKLR